VLAGFPVKFFLGFRREPFEAAAYREVQVIQRVGRCWGRTRTLGGVLFVQRVQASREIAHLVPAGLPDLVRPGGYGDPGEGRGFCGRKPGKNLKHLAGKRIPQCGKFAEFVGFKEFPVFPGIRVEYETAVEVKGLPFPAGKAPAMFRDKGPAAGRTAWFRIYREQSPAAATEAVPCLLSVQKGPPAEGASAGK
jgi:hypothetical protein